MARVIGEGGLEISPLIKPNAEACCREILRTFTWIYQIYTYQTTPDHNNCRCIDYMMYANKALGDTIAPYHIKNADRLGVVRIIWNRGHWRRESAGAGKPARTWTRYTGDNPHTDHVHVEYNSKTYEAPPPPPKQEDDLPEPKDVWNWDGIENVFTGNPQNKNVTPETALIYLMKEVKALRAEVAALARRIK